MSGKLFVQIIVLMVIFAVVMGAAKCLHRKTCPMCKGKMAKCQMMGMDKELAQ
ncbi:hypothetical protein ACFL38_01735 [Candidatus Omnitrophota bacterium]